MRRPLGVAAAAPEVLADPVLVVPQACADRCGFASSSHVTARRCDVAVGDRWLDHRSGPSAQRACAHRAIGLARRCVLDPRRSRTSRCSPCASHGSPSLRSGCWLWAVCRGACVGATPCVLHDSRLEIRGSTVVNRRSSHPVRCGSSPTPAVRGTRTCRGGGRARTLLRADHVARECAGRAGDDALPRVGSIRGAPR